MRTAASLSVVIPLYNEGEAFAAAFGEIRAWLVQTERPFEFVLVDDGSSDKTWEVASGLAAAHPEVRALRFSRNFGKEAAICAGLDHSTGAAVVVMDADLQHPPNLLPEMVRLWAVDGYDVVDAVKRRRGREAFWYKLAAKLFTDVLCSLSGFDMRGASDYKLLDRCVVDAWLSMPERVTFYRAMTEWVGFRHVHLPMEVAPRAEGQSGWNFVRLVRLAMTALTSFSTIALHAATLVGVLFVGFATLFGAYALIRWAKGETLEGFATVILLQLGIGGIIMVMLGIIGEYLSTIFNEVKQRPRYIVQDRL